jgi:hypothetical protein
MGAREWFLLVSRIVRVRPLVERPVMLLAEKMGQDTFAAHG